MNSCDKKYIMAVHKRFGEVPLRTLKFQSLTRRYLKRHASVLRHIRPLNYIQYNLEDTIQILEEFCGFQYYGGKHYESILTRFMQCWYLPKKTGQDKRKSHFSSLIISGQMTRDEALERLKDPPYLSEDLLMQDKHFLAQYLGISMQELESYIVLPPKGEREYPHSFLNELAPVARKFRKYLD